MSLKQEIEGWVTAIGHYDKSEYDDALLEFSKIADTSKIFFNMGVIHATLGEHDKAIELYQQAVSLDKYFAVAYFQQGVSNFLLNDFRAAMVNFNDALLYLRGNKIIDYAQLGLIFKLYSCEVLFNRGLCAIYLNDLEAGMKDLQYASMEKVVEDHDVIDEAIRERADGYTVFSIPVGVIYRPNEAKVRNLKTKDYLGKARLVAAADRNNAFTGFTGAEMKKAVRPNPKDDRPDDNISFAASNLVKAELQSQQQQQSLAGSSFPPTPPPENASPASQTQRLPSRAESVRRGDGLVRSNTASPSLRRPALPQLNLDKVQPDKRQPATSISERRARGHAQRNSYETSVRNSRYAPNSRESEKRFDPYEAYNYEPTKRRPSAPPADDNSDYYDDSPDGVEFEMVTDRYQPSNRDSHRRAASMMSAPAVELQKIRIKVHTTEDVRYVLLDALTTYDDLVYRIQEKFNIRRRFRLKVHEDDRRSDDAASVNISSMVTIGDQDDLDAALLSVKSIAKRERSEIGRMEMWVMELS